VSRALRIGTRGSRLALWQATAVARLLQSKGIRSEIITIRTTGDRSQTGPVPGADTKRQFVKEIEDALLDNVVDVAVHSAKDMTVELPDDLAIAACLPREDPLDAIVLPVENRARGWPAVAEQLERGVVIGTGSIRRIAQLSGILREARFEPVRGNVDTRLGKLDGGQFGALVLACAGLRRLGFGGRISASIPLDQCVPAPGQGIVATEIRAADDEARGMLQQIHDEAAGAALTAERALVSTIGGGCELPLGAIALADGDALELHAVAVSVDGATVVRRSLRGPAARADALGRALAEDLASHGARELLGL
jgi:hydroxymethylbilane synthase